MGVELSEEQTCAKCLPYKYGKLWFLAPVLRPQTKFTDTYPEGPDAYGNPRQKSGTRKVE